MNVRQTLIKDGFDIIVKSLPANFNYEDERVLTNPLNQKRMLRFCDDMNILIQLHSKLLKYSSTSIMGKLYRDLFKLFKEKLLSNGPKEVYGEIPICVLTYGDSIATRVSTVLQKKGISKLKEISYVSTVDYEVLHFHKDSQERFKNMLRPWAYNNLGGL